MGIYCIGAGPELFVFFPKMSYILLLSCTCDIPLSPCYCLQVILSDLNILLAYDGYIVFFGSLHPFQVYLN